MRARPLLLLLVGLAMVSSGCGGGEPTFEQREEQRVRTVIVDWLALAGRGDERACDLAFRVADESISLGVGYSWRFLDRERTVRARCRDVIGLYPAFLPVARSVADRSRLTVQARTWRLGFSGDRVTLITDLGADGQRFRLAKRFGRWRITRVDLGLFGEPVTPATRPPLLWQRSEDPDA